MIPAGEFRRTTRVRGNVGEPFYSPTGRDYSSEYLFAVFAGGGVQGGRVISASDRIEA
jgi:hypothetical protein